MCAGITEVDQEAVADIPGYKASKRVDDLGYGFVVAGDQVAQIFRIEPRRKRSGTNKIAEHHRELPALRPVLRQRRLDLSRMGRNRRAWHLEPGDRPQHPLAMPEQHAEFFEIGFSEFGQCLKVDGIGAKDRLVFRQRKFSASRQYPWRHPAAPPSSAPSRRRTATRNSAAHFTVRPAPIALVWGSPVRGEAATAPS